MNRLTRALLTLASATAFLPSADAGVRDAVVARRQQPLEAAEASGNLDAGSGQRSVFALPPGARSAPDLAYGSDPAQKLDVFIPKDAKAAPIIVMVHGGAWMIGDKANANVVANKTLRWLPKGYIVVSPNYRMSRPIDPIAQADDVARALAYVQSHASAWGGDAARVLLMGHSSGAHLVALLAADPGAASRLGASAWLGTVALDSAALNVVGIMEARHPRFYDQVFGDQRSQWIKASPLYRLTAAPRPMLLVCSSQRGNSCPAAQEFAGKVTSLGGRATVLPVDLKHGEINAELGRADEYTAAVETFMRSLGLP
jgi:arylformamidase